MKYYLAISANKENWKKNEPIFNRNKEKYKKQLLDYNHFVMDKKNKEYKEKILKKYTPSRKKEALYKLINFSQDLEIQSQGERPTCAAFAAVRALEILSLQAGENLKLSEQYFYWASKPSCQTKKCGEKGSWILPALEMSVKSKDYLFPTEKKCPYSPQPEKDNETQIPLAKNCQEAVLKVLDYEAYDDLDSVMVALDKNYPVVFGVKLSANFYGQKIFSAVIIGNIL